MNRSSWEFRNRPHFAIRGLSDIPAGSKTSNLREVDWSLIIYCLGHKAKSHDLWSWCETWSLLLLPSMYWYFIWTGWQAASSVVANSRWCSPVTDAIEQTVHCFYERLAEWKMHYRKNQSLDTMKKEGIYWSICSEKIAKRVKSYRQLKHLVWKNLPLPAVTRSPKGRAKSVDKAGGGPLSPREWCRDHKLKCGDD